MKDDKVKIEVNLTDDEWYFLMKQAHEQDITLNQLITNILREYLDKLEPNVLLTN